MLHITIKGVEHKVSCKLIYSVLTHTLNPQIGSKGQNIFFLVVMLHIKLWGMVHRASCKHTFCPYTSPRPLGLGQSKKKGKDRESIRSSTTPDKGYQWNITNESKEVSLSQLVTTRHQQTDVHESITKQDRNNINDPHRKHSLGTVSKIFYRRA